MDTAAERAARIETILRHGREAARASFDPARHLVGHPAPWAGGGTVYRPPVSLWYAHALLRQGGAEGAGEGDTEAQGEGAAIVAAALDSQERHPDHPHRGNFRWLADDTEVVDLNAVQFELRALLPLLVEHGDRLPASLQARCREAMRLALLEQERMAVAPTYTNIHLMSLFSLLVGGAWLGADGAAFVSLGRGRWAEWVRFTTGSGAPHEFNSPGYGAVDLSALAALHQYAPDPLVGLQARLMYERLWLHLALHLHPPTGQQAGPHCRCYWPMMSGAPPAILDLLWREAGTTFVDASAAGAGARREVPASIELALTAHWLPDAVRAWLEGWREGHAGALPAEVRETANREDGQALTTYLTPQYALGTATRTYSIGQDDFYIEHQANYLLLHYRRPPSDADPRAWGLVYSRYVVNDRHAGTLGAAPDRSPSANFYDQGHFAGAQLRNKAIALYALEPQHLEVFSLKTVVAFPRVETLDEVWLGDRRLPATGPAGLADLPLPVPAGDWLVVADGGVYVGVRPLEASRLGREAPVLLERGPAGELWLTVYNYRGTAKRFWDYASLRGAFWRGNLRAGYVLEVAERAQYPSAAAFRDHLRRAEVGDVTAATDETPLERTVTFRSGGDTLELRYDLWRTRPIGRRLNGAEDAAPALDSPLAVQGDSGTLRAGSATLHTDPGVTVWLIAQEVDPSRRSWTAVVPEDRATSLRLETPRGAVVAARMTAGRIELRAPAGADGADGAAPELLIDALEAPVGLETPAGVRWRR